ncbi:PglL family O-oligosaccharyltransferase [Chromobacterium haemolyticum]|uniref:PglL family O-oligosaccharyltransferase n=1 Tax=Chromobacterium haemolyticum TaxID=394935 RepID=UPI0012DD8D86|nr:Wzy polymerase domain-containing protein [Chromobacterium haemolyticum]
MPFGTLFAMDKNIKLLSFFLTALAISLPFMSWLRYAPLPDWVSDASAFALLGLAMLCLCFLKLEKVYVSWLELVLLVVAIVMLQSVFYSQLAIVFVGLVLFVVLLRSCLKSSDINSLIEVLAKVVVVFALLQSFVGIFQALRMGQYFYGLIVYSPSSLEVVGNVAQRNQYAHFLFWGVLSACYLYAIGRMRYRFVLLFLLPVILAISWSGARLPLAYMLLTLMLVWYWYRSLADDGKGRSEVKSFAWAVVGAALLMFCFQLLNSEIMLLLSKVGLPINVVSGSDRIMDGGLGARRRIEWTKAWLVFMGHPWFGVGWGGFAAETVKMEWLSGLPKQPESSLFTHSHNLFFQLLAETGLFGTVPVALGLCHLFFRLLKKVKKHKESLWLCCVFVVILVHSMFEYPMWYMPFLIMFILICALVKGGEWSVSLRPRFVKGLSFLFGVGFLLYFLVGLNSFWTIVQYSAPSLNEKDNVVRLEGLSNIGRNPFWARDVDMALANYMVPTSEQLDIKLAHFEMLARYRPYPNVLLKLAILRALGGDEVGANKSLKMAIANYPDYVNGFVGMLASQNSPQVVPLRQLAMVAAQAYAQHPPHSEAAQLAAVMTVTAPVTRKPLF